MGVRRGMEVIGVMEMMLEWLWVPPPPSAGMGVELVERVGSPDDRELVREMEVEGVRDSSC